MGYTCGQLVPEEFDFWGITFNGPDCAADPKSMYLYEKGVNQSACLANDNIWNRGELLACKMPDSEPYQVECNTSSCDNCNEVPYQLDYGNGTNITTGLGPNGLWQCATSADGTSSELTGLSA